MAKTDNVLKLSDILDNFNSSMSKVAEDEAAIAQAAAAAPAPAPEVKDEEIEELMQDPEAREALVAKAHEALAEIAANGDPEEVQEVAEALKDDSLSPKEVEISDTLKDLAANVIAKEDGAIQKEASEFGRIFAQSAMEEVAFQEDLQKIAEEAYVGIQDEIQGEEEEAIDNSILQKIAEDAYIGIRDEVLPEATADDGLDKEAAEQIFIESFGVIKDMCTE